jgi:hypothetical protein
VASCGLPPPPPTDHLRQSPDELAGLHPLHEVVRDRRGEVDLPALGVARAEDGHARGPELLAEVRRHVAQRVHVGRAEVAGDEAHPVDLDGVVEEAAEVGGGGLLLEAGHLLL